MSQELSFIVSDAAQARYVLVHDVPQFMQQQWKKGAERIRVTVCVDAEDTSLQQFRFYWGFVLKTISEQVQDHGYGAMPDGWHLFYKEMFLGYRIHSIKVPGREEPRIVRELKTTTALKARRDGGEADPAKYMPDYLDAVMAHAATTYGVRFPDQRWEDWSESHAARSEAV